MIVAASHYATLGVATDSPPKVIRAAYLQLMRRYHPDRNSSAEAAARVRAITAAYAVLSVPEERAKYDLKRRAQRAAPPPAPAAKPAWRHRIEWPVMPRIEWPAMPRIAWPALPRIAWPAVPRIAWPALPRIEWPALPRVALPPVPRIALPPMNRLAWPAMIASGVAFLVIVANVVPDWAVPEKQVNREGIGGKAMTPAPPAEARAVSHLAPGAVPAAGRQDVDGIVTNSLGSPAVGGAPGLSLTATETSSEAVVVQPSIVPQTVATIKQVEMLPAPQVAPTPAIARTPAPPVRSSQPAPAIAQQNPSFSCSGEKNWAEKTICTDAGLAALDRAASSLLGDAMDRASVAQRASLLASDRQFLAGRNSCSTQSCVRSAYLVSMSNIRTIMSGTPLPR
ncbi:MAG TPA: DnaJ domain-containing protein [Sphingomicrobium sp.]